jgi:sugar O-acyltransferase (sialic acid O-acetyltransferase NeuD family)
MKEKVAIYGCGGFAREVSWLISKNPSGNIVTEYYIDDSENRVSHLRDIPVISFEQFLEVKGNGRVSIGVGDPKTRKKIANKVSEASVGFITLVHHSVEICDESIEIGEGSIICAGSILTVDIKIGRHTQINLDCTVGHDVIIGDFVTVSPGAHISGNVHIGNGCYIGTNATIINGTPDQPLTITENTIIGAGACVTKSCKEAGTYVGIPAKKIN